MGGEQYVIGDDRVVDGEHYPSFSDVEDLLNDYNCLHFKFPIILGVSPANYSRRELAELKAKDLETFEFEGKQYTGYEAKQMQRKLETSMRHAKDRQKIAAAAGDDTLRRQEQQRINQLSGKYAEFSKAAGLPTKAERASVSGYHRVKTPKELAKSENSGIIKISSPISSRKHPTGTPEGVSYFGDKLNSRQEKLLSMLPEYDSRIEISKKSVSMRDLSALTAYTNSEYAMFTKSNKRLIIRGNVRSVNIGPEDAKKLSAQGYKWSGHTHPGNENAVLIPSGDDRIILSMFNQKNSVTYNSRGVFYVFGEEERI